MKWQGELEESLDQLQFLTTFPTYSAPTVTATTYFGFCGGFAPSLGQGRTAWGSSRRDFTSHCQSSPRELVDLGENVKIRADLLRRGHGRRKLFLVLREVSESSELEYPSLQLLERRGATVADRPLARLSPGAYWSRDSEREGSPRERGCQK